MALLLDGWNELDTPARKRLKGQLDRLQAEVPELSLLISTRKQVLDVPFGGTRIHLMPLNQSQQLEIARALCDNAGDRMVDQANRIYGLRELVTIPLYLTTLLALPEDEQFPSTKEEILQRFIAMHEKEAHHAEALEDVTFGLHDRFLEDLAVRATYNAKVMIAEAEARKSIYDSDIKFVEEGLITDRPQPRNVLNILVSHHVMVRIGDPPGYTFHHQQFQEWYASHFVDRLMLSNTGDPTILNKLKEDVLNQPVWEEAILFACERLARGNQNQQQACGSAILAAFDVDPMLAAEMIFHSSEAVWEHIRQHIIDLVKRWHTYGELDQALRFMICSGRSEFLELVWPLITHENDQVHLGALRTGRVFRPSLLGKNAAQMIAALPSGIRGNVLSEIVCNSGMDGLDLAATIAKDDPSSEVKEKVVIALAFSRADQHIVDVLRDADEKTFDLVSRSNLLDTLDDEHVKERLDAAHERRQRQDDSGYEQLLQIVHLEGDDDFGGELASVIGEAKISNKEDAIINLIYRAHERYPQAVAEGILQRVRTDRSLFYGVNELVSSSSLILEDDDLLEIALSDTDRHSIRAMTAASVLGPKGVGQMIDELLNARKQLRDSGGSIADAIRDRNQELESRIRYTPGSSLITAISARSAKAGNEEICDLADLTCRHADSGNGRGTSFDAEACDQIYALIEDWGNRLLDSTDATRSQLAEIARLVPWAPSVGLLPLLKRVLDEELRRLQAFREEAMATGFRPGRATDEARMRYDIQYQRAFQSIDEPETAELMREYLHNEFFGHRAAIVLASQWTAVNEPKEGKRIGAGIDFSRVAEKRVARAADPIATSAEAEVIFGEIQPLIADEATEEQKKLAVALGTVAVRLPHGQRKDTIDKLISIATRHSRPALLQNLILSGELIDIELVRNGLDEVFEASKTDSWILSGDSFELQRWLCLLPFTSPLTEAVSILRGLPKEQRSADRLKKMVSRLGVAPDSDAERLLFQLPEIDPQFYKNRYWHDAVIGRGTLSAALRYVNLVADGVIGHDKNNSWNITSNITLLLSEHPKLRTHVYDILENNTFTPSMALLAQAVADDPDIDGLLLLTQVEMKYKRSFITYFTLEKVINEHRPAENLDGFEEIIPVSATELRQKLLAMTTDGSSTDVASRYLTLIDEIRDQYGVPDSEPRHPDLKSGKPWPIIKSASQVD